MEDHFHSLQRGCQRIGLVQIAEGMLQAAGHLGKGGLFMTARNALQTAQRGRASVKGQHAVALFYQGAAELRADETSGAGDEDFHEGVNQKTTEDTEHKESEKREL